MKFKDALRELIESRDSELIIVNKLNNWQVIHPDDCPNYQLYDFVDSGAVFSSLRDIVTPELLESLAQHLLN